MTQRKQPQKTVTRFKCAVCGKVTAGRVPVNPRNHRERGDGTFRYPRKHRGPDGKPCPGNSQEAKWVNVPRAGQAVRRP